MLTLLDYPKKIIALIRKLTIEELEKENKPNIIRRYARIRGLDKIADNLYESSPKTEVLDPADINGVKSDIWGDKDAFSLCGIYVVKTKGFVEDVKNVGLAPFSQTWSFNSLHKGFARALKMSMTLEGYKDLNGIPFLAYKISSDHYLHSIKEDSDIEIYSHSLYNERNYDYRKQISAWND